MPYFEFFHFSRTPNVTMTVFFNFDRDFGATFNTTNGTWKKVDATLPLEYVYRSVYASSLGAVSNGRLFSSFHFQHGSSVGNYMGSFVTASTVSYRFRFGCHSFSQLWLEKFRCCLRRDPVDGCLFPVCVQCLRHLGICNVSPTPCPLSPLNSTECSVVFPDINTAICNCKPGFGPVYPGCDCMFPFLVSSHVASRSSRTLCSVVTPCLNNNIPVCGPNATCTPNFANWTATCVCKPHFGPAWPVCVGSFFFRIRSSVFSLQVFRSMFSEWNWHG